MGKIFSEIMEWFGSSIPKALASALHLDSKLVKTILPLLAPIIVGGLKKQMDERGGADWLNHILDKYGDKKILDDIDTVVEEKIKDDNPDPKLGGLLGESGIKVSETVAEKLGIESKTVMKMIPIIASVVLGFLLKKRDDDGEGASGIASLIDRDGDGAILDDVAGFILSAFGGGFLSSLFGDDEEQQ